MATIVSTETLIVGENHLGKAVFTTKSIKKGEIVTEFQGEILHKNELPKVYRKEKDRFLQISEYLFMGPSGDLDDFINHSCDPNTGLIFTEDGVYLTAIRNIKKGEEITWDYSTTIMDNHWTMRCRCKTEICRKIIGDFSKIDRKTQDKYYKLNIIPKYIKIYMDNQKK